MNLISAGNGQCVAEMVVEKQHTNGYGTLHGGFTAAAVDVLSSMAVLTHPRIVEDIDSAPNSGVSVNINVSYVYFYYSIYPYKYNISTKKFIIYTKFINFFFV